MELQSIILTTSSKKETSSSSSVARDTFESCRRFIFEAGVGRGGVAGKME